MKKNPILLFALMLLLCSCKKDPEACFTSEQKAYTMSFNSCSLNATSYDWDFGDGNFAIGANPDHEYGSFGTYEVSLRVGNEKGTTSTITQNVTFSAPPNYQMAGVYQEYQRNSANSTYTNTNNQVIITPNFDNGTEIYIDGYFGGYGNVVGVVNEARTLITIPTFYVALNNFNNDTVFYVSSPANINSNGSVITVPVTGISSEPLLNGSWVDSLVRI
jgi:PKD repeat protein